ncbi:cupredoxin domain-containing protein [Tateyamaria omphalii]|uniref:cupredoxin domain-containing protein n=1 Tax=Tateyamaria omphalii TaxID=299262 RepID=UPI001671ED56|nr:cupredoxin domain-containing protein [Tateyamaria omphalii]
MGAAAVATAFKAGPSAASGPTTHVVRIKSFAFVPERIDARVGDTIQWVNEDLAPHTATADDFEWDRGELTQNQVAEVLVTDDMQTSYFCVFHPHMKGEIARV